MTAQPEPVAPDMRARIAAELAALERDAGARILLAVESGSRAWGFPSPDSDYDVRFIYLRPLDWYLSIEPGRDVIEKPIDGDLDIGGWDLKKALGLILRSNAKLFEWLRSPVVYRDEPELRADLLDLSHDSFRRAPITYHYLREGTKHLPRVVGAETRPGTKSFCYALRAALALRWLRLHTGPPTPPMAVTELLAEVDLSNKIIDSVEALIALKRQTRERGTFLADPALSTLVAEEFELARGWLAGSPPEPKPGLTAEADALFRDWVHHFG